MEQYQKQLDQVMSNVISRREFLRHLGLVFIGLFGITSMLKNLHQVSQPKFNSKHHGKYGYGGGPYGR